MADTLTADYKDYINQYDDRPISREVKAVKEETHPVLAAILSAASAVIGTAAIAASFNKQ